MKVKNYSFFILLTAIILGTVCSNQISAQFSGKVAFLTTSTAIGADSDKPITDKLKSWGFTVDMFNETDFKTAAAPIPTDADLKNYKLLFVSEAIGSGNLARLRGATAGTWTTGWLPIPCVNTDNWTGRVSSLGFVPASAGYGSIDGNVVIVDQTSHALSAGFSSGTQLSLSTGTTSSVATDQNTYVIPDTKVKVIPIAASVSDNTKLVVFGVEKGTEVYNSAGVFGGTTKTNARYVAVGMHSLSFPNITDDAFKLIKAAITWALTPPTAVETKGAIPNTFSLEQNYPNPFNPSTSIKFSILKTSNVSLKVYDVLGKEVSTLFNEVKTPGNYSAEFTAAYNLPSGIYFYKLSAGNFTSVKKMMLIK